MAVKFELHTVSVTDFYDSDSDEEEIAKIPSWYKFIKNPNLFNKKKLFKDFIAENDLMITYTKITHKFFQIPTILNYVDMSDNLDQEFLLHLSSVISIDIETSPSTQNALNLIRFGVLRNIMEKMKIAFSQIEENFDENLTENFKQQFFLQNFLRQGVIIFSRCFEVKIIRKHIIEDDFDFSFVENLFLRGFDSIIAGNCLGILYYATDIEQFLEKLLEDPKFLTYDFLMIGLDKICVQYFTKFNPEQLTIDISNTNISSKSDMIVAFENYRNLFQMNNFFDKFNIEITDMKMRVDLDKTNSNEKKDKNSTLKKWSKKKNMCAYCHRVENENEKFKVCARCSKVAYCSLKCHKKDWKKKHKKNCIPC